MLVLKKREMRGSRRKTYAASISDLNPGRINLVHRVFWMFGQQGNPH